MLEQFLLPFGIEPPSPPDSPAPHSLPVKKHRTVALQGYHVPYELRRTQRKTVGMTISRGYIQVNAPRWVPVSDIEFILQEKSKWLLARLAEWHHHERQRLLPHEQWADGAELPYLGKMFRIVLAPEARHHTWDDLARELRLPLPASASMDQIRDMVHGWLQQQARALFSARLKTLSAQSGRRYSRFSLSNARGRWGSCSEDGHIRLNWRLIHFGQDVIDYVIAHELAHIYTMDHSKTFWDEVADILPNFEEGKDVLRKVRLDSLPTY